MTYDNKQLIHVWAQQNQSEGRSSTGNLSFRDRSLYSYRTEIARFIGDKVVRTTHRYSVTTSGKHYPYIAGACSHLEYYATAHEMRNIPENWDDAAIILFNEMLRDLKTEINALLRARSSIQWKAEQLAEHCADAWRFYGRYIHTDTVIENSDQQITLSDLSALTSNVAGLEIMPVLENRFGADLKKQIAKEREANTKKRAEIEAREARYIEEQKELIAKWRADSTFNHYFGSVPVMLRIHEDEIETSRGARVPLRMAITAFRAYKLGKLEIGQQIGNFKITRFDDDEIVIGCHIIPMQEVKTLLELKQVNP